MCAFAVSGLVCLDIEDVSPTLTVSLICSMETSNPLLVSKAGMTFGGILADQAGAAPRPGTFGLAERDCAPPVQARHLLHRLPARYARENHSPFTHNRKLPQSKTSHGLQQRQNFPEIHRFW